MDERTTATPAGHGVTVHEAGFDALDAAVLYRILQLRVDVFVVEQRCAYRELDGRDTEPTTRHLWIAAADGAISAYLRALADGDGSTRIGRVVTASTARGGGLAALLVDHVTTGAAGPVVADVQAHLCAWYARRGFAVAGAEFSDEGIPHVPMRYEPGGRPVRDGADA